VANKWVGFSESDWFNTGDIGSISCDGTLSVLGRSKNIVNRGGSKISIEGLEMVFLEHPKIREICVFAKRDHAVGEEVYAAFVGDVSESELRLWSVDKIQNWKCPKAFYSVDFLPRTNRGKINRKEVARIFSGVTGNGFVEESDRSI
ncbi:MAG: hypothetical protein KDD35_01410, partial [Bdellovibrionales bacterium]|nr:hypothetical protein [Bdellovibrionales bacterium]